MYRLLEDLRTIVLEYTGCDNEDVKALEQILPHNDPRFVIFKFRYVIAGNPDLLTKYILIQWIPEACSIQKKNAVCNCKKCFTEKVSWY